MTNNVWLMCDFVGRHYLGIVSDPIPDVVEIINPIIMMESVDPRAGTANLSFGPVLHTVDVTTIQVRWTMKIKADDRMVDAYENFLARIKAARAGIHLVDPKH